MQIVYAYVCGDILHVGHILHLQNAKALGQKLIVGVLTDKAVMEKKPKPTIPFAERIKMVQALHCVNVVVAQTEYSPLNNVKKIRPNILAESTSHDVQPANDFMKSVGGKVVSLPFYPEQSSSKIKNKVKEEKHG